MGEPLRMSNADEWSTNDLYRHASKGDAWALEALWRRLGDECHRVALRLTKDPQLAHDAVLDAWASVLTKERPLDNAHAYFLQATRRAALDQAPKGSKARPLPHRGRIARASNVPGGGA